MKLIVLTLPYFIRNEAAHIAWLLHSGVDTVHVRKPDSTLEQCAALLRDIPEECRGRLVVHGHFSLCGEFGLKGVHLNSRNPTVPEYFRGGVSCSCHSIEEAAWRKQRMDYVFLSPVFDSISKPGYSAAYSPRELAAAARRGLIDGKVIALGGVTASRIGMLREWRFGGAALLGDIWSRVGKAGADAYLDGLRKMIVPADV